MLFPRQLQQQQQQHCNDGKISVKSFKDSGLEVKPIYKKMSQQSHVKKLLSTAATGNAVLEDVEGLLTPIRVVTKSQEQPSPQPQDSSTTKERTERNLWRNDEVLEMMFVMQETKALEKLNDKQMKSETVFKDVETIMHKNGFVKKSHLQIWTKWKFLKSTYMTSRRNGVVPRMIPPEIYNELHQMISGSSECDTSTNGSVNDDSSNTAGCAALYTNNTVENEDMLNTQDDDKLGIAHPIFGFQLGLVKNEPIDNGYDMVENNDSKGENNQTHKMSSPPVNIIMKEKLIKETSGEKTLVVPQRGRGRPPKKLPWSSPSPNSTSTVLDVVTSTQLPPLRVAPFAKVTNSTNVLALSGPPPPLTMPPTSRPIRVTDITNLSSNNNTEGRPLKAMQPKLMPKPQALPQMPQGVQIVRLQSDGSNRTGRASASPSPSYPKMKQVPMRKTPYSLRPDRAIPDLNESLSPPPEKQRRMEEGTTSHLIMQSQSSNGIDNFAKRRSDQQSTPVIQTKLRKLPSDDEDLRTSESDRHPRDDLLYGKLMQTAIVDLSESLRKTQTQMMREFFNRQHELLEREHSFQMQQDQLIMETFNLQTQEIMNSVRDLVASLASDNRNQQQRLQSRKKTAKPLKRHGIQNDASLFVNEDLGHDNEGDRDRDQIEQEIDYDSTDNDESNGNIELQRVLHVSYNNEKSGYDSDNQRNTEHTQVDPNLGRLDCNDNDDNLENENESDVAENEDDNELHGGDKNNKRFQTHNGIDGVQDHDVSNQESVQSNEE